MFIILDSLGQEAEHQRLDLRSSKRIWIEALTVGVIPHDLVLRPCNDPVILIGKTGVFTEKQLWIEVAPVQPGRIFTHVFNMGSKRVSVQKGECISQLLLWPLRLPETRITQNLNLVSEILKGELGEIKG